MEVSSMGVRWCAPGPLVGLRRGSWSAPSSLGATMEEARMFVRKFCGVWCAALVMGLCLAIGSAHAQEDDASECQESCIVAEESCMDSCDEGVEGDACAEDCRVRADACFEECG